MDAVKFSRYDTADYLKTEEEIAAYLDAVMEDGDPALIAAALGDVERARNISQLAREALSIGKEEEKIIEDRVSEKLTELSEKTRQEAFAQGHAEGCSDGQIRGKSLSAAQDPQVATAGSRCCRSRGSATARSQPRCR